MKRLKNLYLVTVLLFGVLTIAANLLSEALQKKNENISNLLMNRIYHEVQEQVEDTESGFGSIAEGGKADEARMSAIIQSCYSSELNAQESEFVSSGLPKKVYFLPAVAENEGVSLVNRKGTNVKLWALRKGGGIFGFLAFEFDERGGGSYAILLNACLAMAFLIAMGVSAYLNEKVLKPFEKLSEYPEKLSKSQISEKLPETKNRMFGEFIWGINMLNDKLTSDRRRIHELSREHLTMVTTIAHGIKTPLSNVRLYADAIESGLYQPDGKPNPSDAEVAGRIRKNADDITELVKKLIDQASSGVVDFEPEIRDFYLSDLITYLEEEYGRRLELLKIPHTFEVSHNALIKSDKDGICRILSQFMENAIKYGNGEGIEVNIGKEEGYHFSVKNKGNALSDQELPYVFNSFWRGSNAEGIEGSGIGLFEAYEIAGRLDGDIYVRTNPERTETTFHLFLNR